jgi:ribosomal protein L32E
MKYIIYKICVADYTYIGSTKDWTQRQYRHKHNFLNENCKAHNLRLYQSIRENGGWDAIEMSPIEEFECETSVQARIREEHWRREYNATLNMMRAHRTEEEHKQYHRERTAECRAAHPEYYTEYYVANREALKQKAKEYYVANCDAIKQYQLEKVQCECGATICRNAKIKHLRTKRHTDRLAEQQQNLAIQ